MPAVSPVQRVILLVEDQEADVVLLKRALQKAGLIYPILSVPGGVEALAYLNGDPPFQDRNRHPLPFLVLLDMRMPVMDGFEVLSWIKRSPQFATLPVVMLTGSTDVSQMKRAYQLGATSFFVKPLEFGSSAELLKTVECLAAKNGL